MHRTSSFFDPSTDSREKGMSNSINDGCPVAVTTATKITHAIIPSQKVVLCRLSRNDNTCRTQNEMGLSPLKRQYQSAET